ncbi:FOG: Ankyrin repeat [Phaffia rhodozyma]|uniref:FOG: Ankyrin repeat n=1 Tax=Phaffia rhodozyma TaxID=264483 RepID=A0A0F7SR73_PHARH|nr:FOG: Ankyrin repeat [Phaffia rhodozyma]
MTTRASEAKNIWIAAGDGDLERVKDLIENQNLSPNVPDENTYTPLHAAASYSQLDVLTYLLSKGGNINLTDEDGETPLFTVESVDTARFLIENGADVAWKNKEGLNAAENLEEEFPEVSTYLRTLLLLTIPSTAVPRSNPPTDASSPLNSSQAPHDEDEDEEDEDGDVSNQLTSAHLSQLMADRLTDEQTTDMMRRFEEVMKKTEEDGVNRDEELAEVVQSVLFNTMNAGRNMATGTGSGSTTTMTIPEESEEQEQEENVKRTRTEPEPER